MRFALCTSLITILFLLAAPPTVQASGFSIYEQSGKASGLAGAWVARADDAAANWYNPAALLWLEKNEFQFGTNFIAVGEDTEFTINDPRFPAAAGQTVAIDGSIETPSHFYYAQKVSNNFAWGIGLNTPFGLVSNWTDRPVTLFASRSELLTFVLNPNFAFRLGSDWSIAVGVDYIFADIKAFGREVPIDLDGNPLNGFEVIGNSDLTGDGDDIGWNLALHRKAPSWSFGFNYRSALSPEIDGNIAFTNFGPLAPFFASSPGTATLNLPDQAAVGFAWETAGSWTWEIDVAWAKWSVFKELAIDIQNNVPGFVDDIRLREDWDDTFSYRFGAAKRTSGPSEWRFGGVIDEGPVPEDTLRPSIPDGDRWGLSVGYGYYGAKWRVDAYYMALFWDDLTPSATSMGTIEDGVILGTYKSFGNLAGVTFGRSF